jgi:hypothetical protein
MSLGVLPFHTERGAEMNLGVRLAPGGASRVGHASKSNYWRLVVNSTDTGTLLHFLWAGLFAWATTFLHGSKLTAPYTACNLQSA